MTATVRSVNVKLASDVTSFVLGVQRAAQATRDLKLALEGADRASEKARNHVNELDASLRALPNHVETEVVIKQTTIGGAPAGPARERGKRDAEEYAGAFGKAVDGEVGKVSQSLFSRLGSAAKQAPKSLTDAYTESFAKGVQGGLVSALTNPAVIATAAPALAPLGAALGGAILTTAGLGGIAAGIVAQLHDPQVDQAAKALGEHVKSGLAAATAGFRQPMIQVLADADAEFAKLQPELKATEGALAPLVETLGRGTIGFVDQLAPGLERAAVASRPLVTDLANFLPRLGADVGNFLDVIAAHASEAQDGLRLLTNSTEVLFAQLSLVTEVGSHAFDWAKLTTLPLALFSDWHKGSNDVKTSAQGAAGALGQMAAEMNAVDSVTGLTKNDLKQVDQELGSTVKTAATYQGAIVDRIINPMLALDHAALSFDESLTKVSKTLKDNKRSLDIHKEAGQADREAVLSAVEANVKQYDSMIQAGLGADKATAQYDANTRALERQLRKAGLTKSQVDGLIGSYRQVPDQVQTDIAANGLTDALTNLGNLIAYINHIDGQKFGFSVVEHYATDYQGLRAGERSTLPPGWHAPMSLPSQAPVPQPHGGRAAPNRLGGYYEHAATGLLRDAQLYSMADPGRYVIAEPGTGGEGFIPKYGNLGRSRDIAGYIVSNWLGGSVSWGGQGSGDTFEAHMHIHTQRADPASLNQWWDYQQARQRVGRRR